MDTELSTNYFSYIQVEFGNHKDEWVDIKKVEIKYNGDLLKIILGPRLNDWSRAIQNKITVDRKNTELVLGALSSIAALGVINNANSGNISSTRTYGAIMAGGLIASDLNKLNNEITDIERSQIFPETHLYSPFSVPPGLVNKRWILIQHPAGTILESLVFEVTYAKSKKKTYSVTINSN